VFGDDRAARDEVIGLVHALGMRGVDGGPLANSTAAEALTSVLIGINRRYKVEGAGIRITGLTPTVEG
jgi:predicted dinucleotide-binding enzyme